MKYRSLIAARSKRGFRQEDGHLGKVQELNCSSQIGYLRLSYLLIIDLIYSLESCVSSALSQTLLTTQKVLYCKLKYTVTICN